MALTDPACYHNFLVEKKKFISKGSNYNTQSSKFSSSAATASVRGGLK